jgi:tetratricopeptide (TPR) repeat protein
MKKEFLILALLFALFKAEAQSAVLKVSDSISTTGNYQKVLNKLLNTKEPSAQILKKIADTYQKVGNHSQAIAFYTKAYTRKPSDKVQQAIGKSYQLVGNPDKAIEMYTTVLITSPNNLLLKYTLAKLYMSERKVKEAVVLFKELIEQDPTNPNYHYHLGLAYDKLKKDSTIGYLKAFKLDSLHLKSIYQLAKFYREVDVKDSTTLFIDKGLEINPKSLNFNQLKAKDAFYNKEYKTTLVYLSKLDTVLNLKTLFTYKLFGLTYLKLEDYKQAEIYFLKAKEEDARDDEVLYNLGLVYANLKDYKKARMNFMMSIYLQKPLVDRHYYQLGMLQLEQNKPKKAIEFFEKGVASNGRNTNLLFQVALTSDSYYKDKKMVIKQYERYLRRFESLDKEETAYAKRRIKEMKKELFIKGEKVD